GTLAPGRPADLMLVRLTGPALTPDTDSLSNILYSAHSDAIDTLICDGRLLMQHHHVEGEEEVLIQARRAAQALLHG
ncbi:MAG: amidohydrolase, partial [Bacteroidales bacterium]|nr:amidohydrolase [Bacteroidales bacterium]